MKLFKKQDKSEDNEPKKKGFIAGFFTIKRILILIIFLTILAGGGWVYMKFTGKSHETSGKVAINLHSQTKEHKSATTENVHNPPPKQHVVDDHKKTGHNTKPKQHTTAAKSGSHKPKGHGVKKFTGEEVPGITFVEACIEPLEHELNNRFWGWRPNDVLNFTDNVNNFQLGVLEVTRRTAVALAENISRTGSTDAYVPSLEFAMNWFMIKPTKYWFPSAESKYQEGLDELKNYIKLLKKGQASFYRRIDNLVPLLRAYESILGSCDENLVKDLGELSFFKADDYLYYTKGIASAMGIILEAVAEDFKDTIESIQGEDVLHHAIVALHHASTMSPWIVLEGSPDSLLANHRANMAAPISHARFFLGVLVNALTGNIS